MHSLNVRVSIDFRHSQETRIHKRRFRGLVDPTTPRFGARIAGEESDRLRSLLNIETLTVGQQAIAIDSVGEKIGMIRKMDTNDPYDPHWPQP